MKIWGKKEREIFVWTRYGKATTPGDTSHHQIAGAAQGELYFWLFSSHYQLVRDRSGASV